MFPGDDAGGYSGINAGVGGGGTASSTNTTAVATVLRGDGCTEEDGT